jgi:hypothetical protein
MLDRDKCFADIFVRQSIKKIIADNFIVYLTIRRNVRYCVLQFLLLFTVDSTENFAGSIYIEKSKVRLVQFHSL